MCYCAAYRRLYDALNVLAYVFMNFADMTYKCPKKDPSLTGIVMVDCLQLA